MSHVDDLDKEEEQEKHSTSRWIREHWRPMMAMQYLLVCVFDFVIAPVAWTVFQAHHHQTLLTQWNPTTLGSGGTYHLAMGAVLGVAAWTRSMDKQDEMMRGAYARGQTGAGMYGGTPMSASPRPYTPMASMQSSTATTTTTSRTTATVQPQADEPTPRQPLAGME